LSDEYRGVFPAFKVRIRTEREPACVRHLPDEQEVSFTYADGWTAFEVKKLEMLEMFEIRFSDRS